MILSQWDHLYKSFASQDEEKTQENKLSRDVKNEDINKLGRSYISNSSNPSMGVPK